MNLLLTTIASIALATGCDSSLKPVTVANAKLNEKDCEANIEYPGCRDFLNSINRESLLVESLSPLNSSKDMVVMLSGTGFHKDLQLTIADQRIGLNVISETE